MTKAQIKVAIQEVFNRIFDMKSNDNTIENMPLTKYFK